MKIVGFLMERLKFLKALDENTTKLHLMFRNLDTYERVGNNLSCLCIKFLMEKPGLFAL